MYIVAKSVINDPDDPGEPDDPDDPDDPVVSGISLVPLWDQSGTTFLSSFGFFLSERTSGVPPVFFMISMIVMIEILR
jgi:hypothetical protein